MGLFFLFSTLVIWGMAITVFTWLTVAFPTLLNKLTLFLGPILITACIVGGISYTRTHYHWGTDFLYYAAYILFGFLFLAFCTTAFFAVLYWILKFFHGFGRSYIGPISIVTTLTIWVMALWGGFSAPAIKRIAVQSPDLPKMKLALLSDSHLGRGVSLARFDKALKRLEAEKPDALLVLGDVFEYGENSDAYAARLAAFKTPQGSYGVLGNHEYYVGYGDSKEFFQKSNIVLLENALTQLSNGVQVAGLKDIKTAGVTAQETVQLIRQADPQKPLILLSHTPLYAQEAAIHGTDLMFSGHTHNGQIWPFNYLVRLQFPRVYGLFDVNGMKFYITSGMFYWGIPLRFLAPAELPIIEVN